MDDPTPSYDDLKKLTEPTRHKGRSYAGFNPAREEEARLFAAVLAGDHHRSGVSQQGHPSRAAGRPHAGQHTAQRGRRSPPQTLAGAWLGGESAAHTTLARDGNRSTDFGRHPPRLSPLRSRKPHNGSTLLRQNFSASCEELRGPDTNAIMALTPLSVPSVVRFSAVSSGKRGVRPRTVHGDAHMAAILVVGTRNPKKRQELVEILGDLNLDLRDLDFLARRSGGDRGWCDFRGQRP